MENPIDEEILDVELTYDPDEHWNTYRIYDSAKPEIYTERSFTKGEFDEYMKGQIKRPGEYGITKGIYDFITRARNTWIKHKLYCTYARGSYQEKVFWVDQEKPKMWQGFIVDDMFIPGWMYLYVNYCPIYQKKLRKTTLPKVYDTDLWYFQILTHALCIGRFVSVAKTRQRGFTLKNLVPIISALWFEDNTTNYIGASLDDYNGKAWAAMETYKNHLNEFTRLTRNFNPSDTKYWKQAIEVDEWVNGKKKSVTKGGNSSVKKVTFNKSPTSGVGGAFFIFFYEEAGIAPTLLETIEYMLFGVKEGKYMTGLIIASGAAGQLKESQGLSALTYRPAGYNCYEVDLTGFSSTVNRGGLFVPECWSLEGFMDEYGNSDVEGAKKWIVEVDRPKAKRDKPQNYDLYCAQGPLTVEEMFSLSGVGTYPKELVAPRLNKLKALNYFPPVVLLKRMTESIVNFKYIDAQPLWQYPHSVGNNNESHVVMYEPPVPNPPEWFYFAGVDTIDSVLSDISDSLFSIHIMRGYHFKKGVKQRRKLVASYTGRYRNPEKCFEIGLMLIVLYGAKAAIENDKKAFVEYMVKHNAQRFMLKRSQMPILKELVPKSRIAEEYGFKSNSGSGRILQHLHDCAIRFLWEKAFDSVEDGNAFISTEEVYEGSGAQTLDEVPLLEEMSKHNDKNNFDRLISFGAVCMITELYANRGIMVEMDDPEETVNQYKPQGRYLGEAENKKKRINSHFGTRYSFLK